MMKKIILVLLVAPIFAFAQLSYPDSTFVNVQGTTGNSTDLKMHFVNESGAVIDTLKWKVLESSIPESWGFWTICDYGNCYVSSLITDGQEFEMYDIDTVETSDYLMKLTVTPSTMTDTARLSIVMYTSDNSINDTLTFEMNDILNSVSEINKSSISLYPNPANDQINVTIADQNAQLDVYSILGQRLISSQLVNGQNLIDMSDLEKGYYFFSIESASGRTVERVSKR